MHAYIIISTFYLTFYMLNYVCAPKNYPKNTFHQLIDYLRKKKMLLSQPEQLLMLKLRQLYSFILLLFAFGIRVLFCTLQKILTLLKNENVVRLSLLIIQPKRSCNIFRQGLQRRLKCSCRKRSFTLLWQSPKNSDWLKSSINSYDANAWQNPVLWEQRIGS